MMTMTKWDFEVLFWPKKLYFEVVATLHQLYAAPDQLHLKSTISILLLCRHLFLVPKVRYKFFLWKKLLFKDSDFKSKFGSFHLTRVFLRPFHNTQLSWISTDFNSFYSGWWRYQLNTKLIFIIELYSPPHTSPSIQVKFLTSQFVLRIFMIFVKKNEVVP